MSLGLVTLFVDKSQHDSISFLSAATGGSENLSIFRTVSPSQPFHVASDSRSINTYASFNVANSYSFRVVTIFRRHDGGFLIELWDARSGSLMWEKQTE